MSEMIEVVIDSIRVGLMSQQRVVILREVDAERYLAIWIDPYMAEQITFALQEVEVARPMTHDLIREMVRNLDARVVRVEVQSLKSDVYYGNVVVEVNGRTVDIDSRPSDALAIVTDWHEYRHPEFERIKSLLKAPIIVDGRNLYSVDRMRELGFTYHSIGRPTA